MVSFWKEEEEKVQEEGTTFTDLKTSTLTGINHNISQDGRTAVLTVDREFFLSDGVGVVVGS